ncbi:melanoma-associated antigen C1-like isoform X1 [Mya arenaria]|uniref:melanoma-associated antigen C1-like isoform X1 n=1 Tax=Mya arenaria TaxID=6604 RepID=UPI0022E5050A|nr:melanoma-associated antigen C1-like isoform X1 [Mya arenaria]
MSRQMSVANSPGGVSQRFSTRRRPEQERLPNLPQMHRLDDSISQGSTGFERDFRFNNRDIGTHSGQPNWASGQRQTGMGSWGFSGTSFPPASQASGFPGTSQTFSSGTEGQTFLGEATSPVLGVRESFTRSGDPSSRNSFFRSDQSVTRPRDSPEGQRRSTFRSRNDFQNNDPFSRPEDALTVSEGRNVELGRRPSQRLPFTLQSDSFSQDQLGPMPGDPIPPLADKNPAFQPPANSLTFPGLPQSFSRSLGSFPSSATTGSFPSSPQQFSGSSMSLPEPSTSFSSSPQSFPSLSQSFTGSSQSFPGSSESLPVSTQSFPGSSQSFPRTSQSFPGSSQSFTGLSQSFPGSSQSFPGSSRSFPGSSQSFPDSSQSFPGSSQSFPGLSQSFPEPSQSFPEPSQSFPGSSQSFPGSSQSFPEPSQSFPGSSQSFPDSSKSFTDSSQLFPGTSQSFPGTSQSFPGSSQSFPVSSQSFPGTSQSFPGSSQSFPNSSQSFSGSSLSFSDSSQSFSDPSQSTVGQELWGGDKFQASRQQGFENTGSGGFESTLTQGFSASSFGSQQFDVPQPSLFESSVHSPNVFVSPGKGGDGFSIQMPNTPNLGSETRPLLADLGPVEVSRVPGAGEQNNNTPMNTG